MANNSNSMQNNMTDDTNYNQNSETMMPTTQWQTPQTAEMNYYNRQNSQDLTQLAGYNLPYNSMSNRSGITCNYAQGAGLPYVSTPTTSMQGNQMQNMPAGMTQTYPAVTAQNSNLPSNVNTTVPSNLGSTYPVHSDSMNFLNGFLRTQVGKIVQIEFLLGTTGMEKRTGILMGLGSDFLLINEIGSNDVTACDFYTIKFITILHE